MKKYFLQTFLLVSLCSCQSQECDDLPENFASFESAKDKIHNAAFEYEDSFDTSRSSWIKSAQYYSCNGDQGYVIVSTNSNSYIHKNVPEELWEKFKVASSLGRFYNFNLKNNYQLKPKN